MEDEGCDKMVLKPESKEEEDAVEGEHEMVGKRGGSATAPQSPRASSRRGSSPLESRANAQRSAKRSSPATYRTAPSSPARQQSSGSVRGGAASPQRSCRNTPLKSIQNANEFSPNSCEGPLLADRRSFEKPPRSSASDKSRKTSRSRTSSQQQQHRKSNSNESGTIGSDLLPLVDEDALSNASSLDLGPLLLKLASAMHLSGENPLKALECASRAAKFLERAAGGKPSLDLVMSLHILAAIYCRLGQWEDAIPVLQRSISIPYAEDSLDHALAAFAAHMQLGDVLAMLGQQGTALASYQMAYQIQKNALGEMHPNVGETCSYLAEAYLQALQFQEAAQFCENALAIHGQHKQPGSVEEALDRRLMALILSGNGDYELALEHLVLANVALMANGRDADVAAVDSSIGDMYVALGRFDEAVFSYHKALSLFKSTNGDGHTTVASVYVSLAEQYMKTGKHREAKAHCESALRIYGRQNAGHSPDDLASGLTEIASVYESMTEREQALMLLQRALDILEGIPGQQSAAAGVQGQMGVLYYVVGRYEESFLAFKNSISKLRAVGERRSALLGILLNQMGLACVGLNEIWHAADIFEEAKIIFEEIWGAHHADTLAVCSNLAGVYDALGRSGEAIDLLENIVDVKEERLGTVHPEVEEERHRLMQLLKEAGRDRVRKTNTLEELLLNGIESSRDRAS